MSRRIPVVSASGRRQLAEENANSVSVPMPSDGAAATARRTASTPARWPARRGSPRARAQRPLPSMAIATWKPCGQVLGMAKYLPMEEDGGSPRTAPLGRADQRLHPDEVVGERAAARRRQGVLGARHAALEALLAGDVAGVLELARVDGQVPVRQPEQVAQFLEREQVVRRERRDDAQPRALVDELVELRRLGARAGDL